MKYSTQNIDWKGKNFTVSWIKTNSIKEFNPITQVYGVCFNDKNEILISRRSKDGAWIIPGGTPEKEETIEETLKREMIEEVDVKVKNIKVLGAQKVIPTDSPDKFYYQIRCVCEVEELLPQTPDPDNGDTWERTFVPQDKITDYVKWGIVGAAMFNDAIQSHH